MEHSSSEFFSQMQEKDFLNCKIHSIDNLEQKYHRILQEYLIELDFKDNFDSNQLKFFNLLFEEITTNLDYELKTGYKPYLKLKLNCLLELVQLGKNSKFIQEKSVEQIQKIIKLLVTVIENMKPSDLTDFKYILDALHSNYLLNDFINYIKLGGSKKQKKKASKEINCLFEQQVIQILGYYQNYDLINQSDIKLMILVQNVLIKLMNLVYEQVDLLHQIFELLFRTLMFDISSQKQPECQYDLHRYVFSQLQYNIQSKFKKFLNKVVTQDLQKEDKLKMTLGGVHQIFMFNQQIVLDIIPEINSLLKESALKVVFFLQIFHKAPIQFSQNYPNFYKEILEKTLSKSLQNQEFIFMMFVDLYRNHNRLFRTKKYQILTKEEQQKINILLEVEDHLYNKIQMQGSDCSYHILKELFRMFEDSQYSKYTFSENFVKKQLCPLVYLSIDQNQKNIIYQFISNQFKQIFSQYYDKQQYSIIQQRQVNSENSYQNQQKYDNLYLNSFLLEVYGKLDLDRRIYYYHRFVELFMNENRISRLVGLCLNMNYDEQSGNYSSDYLKIDNFYRFIFNNFSKLDSSIDDPSTKYKQMMQLYQYSKNFQRLLKSLSKMKIFFRKVVEEDNDKHFHQKLVQSMQQLMPKNISFTEILDQILSKSSKLKKILSSDDCQKKKKIVDLFDKKNDEFKMVIDVLVIDDVQDQELDRFIEQILQHIRVVQQDMNVKENLLILYSQIIVLENLINQFITIYQKQQIYQIVHIFIQIKELLIQNYNQIMKYQIFIDQGNQNNIIMLINYQILQIFQNKAIVDKILDHQLLDSLEQHLIELVQMKQLSLKIQKKAMYLLISVNKVREDDTVDRLMSRYKLGFDEKLQNLNDIKNKVCLFYCYYRYNEDNPQMIETSQLLEINQQILNSMVYLSKQDLVSQESILKNQITKLSFHHLYQYSGSNYSIEYRQRFVEMLFEMVVYNDFSFKEIYQSDFVYLKYKLLKVMIQILKYEKNKEIINKLIIALGLTSQNRYIMLTKILHSLIQQNIKEKDLFEYHIHFTSIYYLLVVETEDEFRKQIEHYLEYHLKVYSKQKIQSYQEAHKLKYASIENCYEFTLVELVNFAVSLPNLYLDKFNSSNVYQIFAFFIKNYKNNLNNRSIQLQKKQNLGHKILNILFSYMLFHQPVLAVDKDRFADHFRIIGKTVRKNQIEKEIKFLLEFEKISQQQVVEIANKFNEDVGLDNNKAIYLLKYGFILKMIYCLINVHIGDIIEEPKQKYQYKFQHHSFRRSDRQEQIYVLKVFEDQVYLNSVLNVKTKSKDINSTFQSNLNNNSSIKNDI